MWSGTAAYAPGRRTTGIEVLDRHRPDARTRVSAERTREGSGRTALYRADSGNWLPEQVILPARHAVVVGEPRAGRSDLIMGLRRALDPRSWSRTPDLSDVHRPAPEPGEGAEDEETVVEETVVEETVVEETLVGWAMTLSKISMIVLS